MLVHCSAGVAHHSTTKKIYISLFIISKQIGLLPEKGVLHISTLFDPRNKCSFQDQYQVGRTGTFLALYKL